MTKAAPATVHRPNEEAPEGSVDLSEYRFWVIPHTHWDREWYLPMEYFRLQLIRVVDEIIDVLEADPRMCFTLDGQAVILEDYLEVQPQMRDRLRALIATGRIAIGPSYVLPDEFIIGAETHVRNFQLGDWVCRNVGGAAPMPVGYIPDTFGHIAQMPQILRGFGIDSFLFQRGLGDDTYRLGAGFTWRGPDGSELLAIPLMERGYSAGAQFGRFTRRGGYEIDPIENAETNAARRLREMVEYYHARYVTSGLRDVAFCNGTDHVPIQRNLPELLDAARKQLPGTEIQIATYEQYINAVRKNFTPSAEFEGELVGGLEQQVTRGVNSTRMYLKQECARTERALYDAEALASLAWLKNRYKPTANFSYDYPQGHLRLAWRELLKACPHDSICGCSIDEVHRDMLPRFTSAQQICAAVQREAFAALASRNEDWEWNYNPASTSKVSVTNTLSFTRAGTVCIPIPTELYGKDISIVYWCDEAQRMLLQSVQVVTREARRFAIASIGVSGFATQQFEFQSSENTITFESSRVAIIDGNILDNDTVRVEVHTNGSITITNLERDVSWTDLHVFEDCADRGDEYNFCTIDGEVPWTSRNAVVTIDEGEQGSQFADLFVSFTADLPSRLADNRQDRIGCAPTKITTRIRLCNGTDRVEFTTTVDNSASDHRLRVLFPNPHHSGDIRAEGHFNVVHRPRFVDWGEDWLEPPQTTNHTSGFVAAGDLMVLGKGLPEYEAVPYGADGTAIALTLLRCVGWLSRDDIPSRPFNAGPHVETPEAQCHGLHVFEYAVSLRGDVEDWQAVQMSQDYCHDLILGPGDADANNLISIDRTCAAASALKLAEDGEGIVLRMFSTSNAGIPLAINTCGKSVERVRLDEREIEPSELVLAPHAIGTFKIQ